MSAFQNLKSLKSDNSQPSQLEKMMPEAVGERIVKVPVSSISRWNLKDRQIGDFGDWENFKDSIEKEGVKSPVIIRHANKEGENSFELITGERRWRACQEVGIKEIPAIIRVLTDKEALVEQRLENSQRDDVSAYSLGLHFSNLIAQGAVKNQQEICSLYGMNKSSVSRYMSFTQIDPKLLDDYCSNKSEDKITRINRFIIEPIMAETLVRLVVIGKKEKQYKAYIEAILEHASSINNKKIGVKRLENLILNSVKNSSDKIQKTFINDENGNAVAYISGTKHQISISLNNYGKKRGLVFSKDEMKSIEEHLNSIIENKLTDPNLS